MRKYVGVVGNGRDPELIINHGLGTTEVIVQVWENEPFNAKLLTQPFGVRIEDNDRIALSFSPQPQQDQYRVVVIG